jgi:hypothetical protein
MFYVVERINPRYTFVIGGGIGKFESAKELAESRAGQKMEWSEKSEVDNRYHAKSSDGRLFEVGERNQ